MNFVRKSYTKNYVLTYFWQGLSILFNLVSMFIVIPYITDNKLIYGIYSVCISTSIFLNYADIGFVSASIKYAGESFAREDRESELQYYGLAGFILFLIVSSLSGIYLWLAYHPTLIIADISSPQHLSIASKLLIIQAVFSYTHVLQRYVASVYQVRIEQYYYQSINMVANISKIVAVFYFFGDGRYQIVEYFLFTKAVEFLATVIAIALSQQRYKIPFSGYLKNFRLNRQVFQRTRVLAFGSLYTTLTWILFFELDLLVIGRFYGAASIAIYALPFTFTKFLRSITSVVYNPFRNRYNHFIGLEDMRGLKNLLEKVIRLTLPLIATMVLSIVLLSSNIIATWAGSEYARSVGILILLSAGYFFSFIRVPGANMLVAMEKIKEMYRINTLMVLTFWAGIFLTQDSIGVLSFAVFKLVAGLLATAYYLNVILKILGQKLSDFLDYSILAVLLSLAVQSLVLIAVQGYLPVAKSMSGLITVVFTGFGASLLAVLTLIVTSRYYRSYLFSYLRKLKAKEA